MILKEKIEQRCEPEPMSGCWLWTGSIFADGRYGRMKTNGKTRYAHRLSYEAYKGAIPRGLHIDHLCRNTLCVNPSHLEACTCKENLMRSPLTEASKRSKQTHCKRGHSLDYVAPNGLRGCKTCRADAVRRSRLKAV